MSLSEWIAQEEKGIVCSFLVGSIRGAGEGGYPPPSSPGEDMCSNPRGGDPPPPPSCDALKVGGGAPPSPLLRCCKGGGRSPLPPPAASLVHLLQFFGHQPCTGTEVMRVGRFWTLLSCVVWPALQCRRLCCVYCSVAGLWPGRRAAERGQKEKLKILAVHASQSQDRWVGR